MNFDGIYNYFEHMVQEEVTRILTLQDNSFSRDGAEDIACLALNQLPAKYVRHYVDAAFLLAEGERGNIEVAVAEAVKKALQRIKTHPGIAD